MTCHLIYHHHPHHDHFFFFTNNFQLQNLITYIYTEVLTITLFVMASSSDSTAGIPTMTKPPLESSSWCFTDSKPPMMVKYDVKHTQVWTIGDIREKIKMETGCFLESDKFSIKIGDKITDWYIKMYPNGPTDTSIGHISVFLKKNTDTDFPVDVKYVITFVDNNGVKGESGTGKKLFDKPALEGWGWDKFLSHAKLREFFPDDDTDSLTVMGEVNIKGGGVSLVASGASGILVPGGNEEASARKCLEDMGNLFNAGKFTDVTIVCQDEGKEFKCHKAILAGRSPVFEAMFSHSMKETQENKVTVEDIDADTFEAMLMFMYSGKVKNLQKEKAAKLLAAGEKYQMLDLKLRCEESLSINLKVDNVLDVLVTAYLHNASSLQSLAMKFIAENAKEVSAQKGWREKLIQLQKIYPELIVDVIDVLMQK